MTHDSSQTSASAETKTKIMKTPSEITLSFIRQYARVCTSLICTNFPSVIIN